jgi:hypothetical protein
MGGNLMLAGAAADTKGREVGTAALGFPPHKRQKNVVARHFIALNGRLNLSRSYDTHVYRLAGCCASDLAEAGAFLGSLPVSYLIPQHSKLTPHKAI